MVLPGLPPWNTGKREFCSAPEIFEEETQDWLDLSETRARSGFFRWNALHFSRWLAANLRIRKQLLGCWEKYNVYKCKVFLFCDFRIFASDQVYIVAGFIEPRSYRHISVWSFWSLWRPPDPNLLAHLKATFPRTPNPYCSKAGTTTMVDGFWGRAWALPRGKSPSSSLFQEGEKTKHIIFQDFLSFSLWIKRECLGRKKMPTCSSKRLGKSSWNVVFSQISGFFFSFFLSDIPKFSWRRRRRKMITFLLLVHV